jgi:hypothetical protein
VARNIDPYRYSEVKLSIIIDTRGYTKNPNILSNYWENFIELNIVARLPVTSLLEGISLLSISKYLINIIYLEAVYYIHRAIAIVDNKVVRYLIGLLNQIPKSTILIWNINHYPGLDILLIYIQGYKYNNIYFGYKLGYPSVLRCTIGNIKGKPDSCYLILPSRHNNSKGLKIVL